ncbi:rhodanese-like domain-containing protein [Ectobacillus funiculus]|uniref:rhodanese-like domain-containing protein n=1 Tax=Ectobacillus funiculus TaxID=137993 RepID=UPI00101DB10B|nr:rhodanese-like domain-containing protein [Ectobacillus funiculus]
MKHITPKEVESFLKQNQSLNIIDVREVEEVATGKIPGAWNIPLGLLEFRMHELDKTKEYILICRSGTRSARATELLEGHGFSVTNMMGGMLVWEGIIK